MVYLAGTDHVFGPIQTSKLYSHFLGHFSGVGAHFVVIRTCTFCLHNIAGVPYENSGTMVSILQCTKTKRATARSFQKHYFCTLIGGLL